jgi:hypothetical protein
MLHPKACTDRRCSALQQAWVLPELPIECYADTLLCCVALCGDAYGTGHEELRQWLMNATEPGSGSLMAHTAQWHLLPPASEASSNSYRGKAPRKGGRGRGRGGSAWRGGRHGGFRANMRDGAGGVEGGGAVIQRRQRLNPNAAAWVPAGLR